MIWLFEREGRRARIEVLYLAPDQYELRFTDSDGVAHVEDFNDATAVGVRQLELEETLIAPGWPRTGGWKICWSEAWRRAGGMARYLKRIVEVRRLRHMCAAAEAGADTALSPLAFRSEERNQCCLSSSSSCSC
jgi:hypothetical protein